MRCVSEYGDEAGEEEKKGRVCGMVSRVAGAAASIITQSGVTCGPVSSVGRARDS